MSTILVIYHSDTGNTRKLAQLIAEGAASAAGVTVKAIEAGKVDMAEAAKADGYAIGSPDYFSYVAGSIKTFFDKAFSMPAVRGKPFAAFGTHGGGGKVLAVVQSLGKAVKLKEVGTGVLTNSAPSDQDAVKARALGKALAEAVSAK